MISITQATGPIEGRPQAPPDVRQRLSWPPEGNPGYDMSDDAYGKVGQSIVKDSFRLADR